MKKFSLSFQREEIYDRLADGMAFAGVRGRSIEESPERVGISRADRVLLDSYFDEAVGGLLSEVRSFLEGVENSLQELTLQFLLPDTFDVTLKDVIGESLRSYLLWSLAWRWKETVMPERVESAKEKAGIALGEVVSNLCFRKPPSRPVQS